MSTFGKLSLSKKAKFTYKLKWIASNVMAESVAGRELSVKDNVEERIILH